ncbi:N-acetylmuramoyl-L-alanine amidase [Terrimonas pollutisoli]|uniref:N-acetylmuramoyl-L-alanine amidase n=1 Tax=Terrimonas pollutisoli TaxID=3034147 RepID=UPI0023ED0923|nr:N-acetylmuramoyl-L-alanine amidase [Terrimonas sp. H1YJ31]
MRNILLYLFQSILSSGILYAYYHFFLRNKKFHRYNRYYLLSIVVISIIIPFLQIPVYFDDATTTPFLANTLTTISSGGFEEEAAITAVTAKESWFTFKNILSLLYIIVGLILFVRFLLALLRIARMITIYPKEQLDNIQFIATTDPATPFSFFRWLFWNNKIELNSDNGQQIFRHELFHIRQKHSWDIIFLEIISMLVWINPFFHLIKREIKVIHEFLADKFAVEENKEWDYAELLLMQVLGSPNTRLTNPFFHNQIKRRIAMLTTSKKPGYQYMRKIMVLPLAAIVMLLFAFTYKNKANGSSILPEKPITIVVDAGHGGDDPGAWTLDGKYNEAQLSLDIAKTIQELAKEYHINIIMTREDKKFPGGASDKNEALRKIVALTNNTKPDAFISIHLNTITSNKKNQSMLSGIDAYVSNKREDEKGKQLASVILQQLSLVYKTREEIKYRTYNGIFVLDKSNCPAVLLECGFIDNAKDLAFITDKNNQQKIARSILEGIVKFKNAKTSANPDQSQLMNDTVPKSKDDNIIFEKLEIEPSFPGGQTAWTNYITKHIDTNQPIQKGAPSGNYTVFVQFVVNKEGGITDVKPLTKHGYGMEEQAVEAIKKGPRWIPGAQNGFKVNAYKKQRFDFIVEKNKKTVSFNTDNIKPNNEVVVVGYKTNQTDNKPVFEKVEIEPSFPGGDVAWRRYLERNANSMVPVDKGAPSGVYKVMVQYIVKDDGSIHDVKALTSFGYGMEAEAIRVLENSPAWLPAMQNGKKVNAYKKQPITFIVEEEKNNSSEKNETTVAGYARDSSKQIEEVKVVGYGTGKPNKVKEVTVIGYPR